MLYDQKDSWNTIDSNLSICVFSSTDKFFREFRQQDKHNVIWTFHPKFQRDTTYPCLVNLSLPNLKY